MSKPQRDRKPLLPQGSQRDARSRHHTSATPRLPPFLRLLSIFAATPSSRLRSSAASRGTFLETSPQSPQRLCRKDRKETQETDITPARRHACPPFLRLLSIFAATPSSRLRSFAASRGTFPETSLQSPQRLCRKDRKERKKPTSHQRDATPAAPFASSFDYCGYSLFAAGFAAPFSTPAPNTRCTSSHRWLDCSSVASRSRRQVSVPSVCNTHRWWWITSAPLHRAKRFPRSQNTSACAQGCGFSKAGGFDISPMPWRPFS